MALRKALPTLLALGVLAAAAPVVAGSSGQLAGSVLDTRGAPLPGVTVTAASPAQIGGEQRVSTDVRGRFLYPRLAPGVYEVRFELDGFVTQELQEVQVRLDRTTEVEVILPLASYEEEMTVTELTPVVDPVRVSAGQTLTSDYLEAAAIGWESRWSYQEVLTQVAGAAEAGIYQGAPAMLVHGSTASDNIFLVDGLDTTNPYWGTALTNIPLDSIREINFEAAGYEAQYGRAPGGVVNALTKSGSNELSASLDLRYRDDDLETPGRHYDPDEQRSTGRILGATVGGRLVRDRAWTFAALESLKLESTPTGSPTTFEGSGERGYLKLTGQATPSLLAVGKFHTNPQEWRNVYPSPFVAPEANGRWTGDEEIVQAELSTFLGEDLLWEFEVGRHRFDELYEPMSGDSSVIGHSNQVTGSYSVNEAEQWARETRREQVGTGLTWFFDDLRGSHELAAGAEHHETSLELESCLLGVPDGGWCRSGGDGFYFIDGLGAAGESTPLLMWIRPTLPRGEFAGTVSSLYLQDTWRALPDLTLKPGLRWDRAAYDDDTGREVAELEMIQPRLGMAWDVTGNGRNLLRGSWGRYMHAAFLQLPRLARTTPDRLEWWGSCTSFGMPDPALCEAVGASLGYPWRADPEGWDPAGWLLGLVQGSDPTTVVPGLEPPRSDTLLIAFERELMRRTALEIGYIEKRTRDLINDTCAGNHPTPAPEADCSAWLILNPPQARRDYRAWTVRFESRALDRFHLLASFTDARSEGSTGSPRFDSGAFDIYPFHYVNRYGRLEDDGRSVKLSGFVGLPRSFDLAFSGRWSSGRRWTPYVSLPGLPGVMAVEPRGSREGEEMTQLDLQLGRGFSLGRVEVRLIGTVLNLFDSEAVSGVCEDAEGCGGFAFEAPLAWQQPRRYELGLRVEL